MGLGILASYAVLMGWTGRTLLQALLVGLPADIAASETFFSGISSGGDAVFGHLASLGLTALVVAAGVRSGIERLCRWAMPLLFLMLAGLLLWAAFLPGAGAGYQGFLLRWEAGKLLDPATIRNAFTQAFFSVGTGIGAILAYAAYLGRRSGIATEALVVVGVDTAVGLMAGCVTFPLVASFGLEKLVGASTVGALFIALPTGLASLGPTGRLVATAFFALAYLAAITSSVSLLEVPVSSLMNRFGWSRPGAVWRSVAVLGVLGVPAALDTRAVEGMDAIFGGVLLLLGGFWMALLLGWRAPDRFLGDLEGCGTSRWLRLSLLVALRWVAPPALALGLVASLTDLIGRWLPG